MMENIAKKLLLIAVLIMTGCSQAQTLGITCGGADTGCFVGNICVNRQCVPDPNWRKPVHCSDNIPCSEGACNVADGLCYEVTVVKCVSDGQCVKQDGTKGTCDSTSGFCAYTVLAQPECRTSYDQLTGSESEDGKYHHLLAYNREGKCQLTPHFHVTYNNSHLVSTSFLLLADDKVIPLRYATGSDRRNDWHDVLMEPTVPVEGRSIKFVSDNWKTGKMPAQFGALTQSDDWIEYFDTFSPHP